MAWVPPFFCAIRPESVGLAGEGVLFQLYDRVYGRLIAYRARAVALASLGVRLGVLIAAERHLARPHLHALAVHGFHEPTAGERHDPLRLRVLVPLAHPAHGLDDHHHCGPRRTLSVQPT